VPQGWGCRGSQVPREPRQLHRRHVPRLPQIECLSAARVRAVQLCEIEGLQAHV
jgi:hypothetical protein